MNVVILTGAGISAESGVPVFRGSDGLWEGHQIDDVATYEGYQRDPELVQQFYNARRAKLLDGTVDANPAHLALARLARELTGQVMLVTQNIDDLHERGGSPEVLHMHGELLKSRCELCDTVQECRGDLCRESVCAACGKMGGLRPHVVWFGEMPFYLNDVGRALQQADLFVSIGTSGKVYPASGFVDLARMAGVKALEINLDPSEMSAVFDESRRGTAGELVPEWVDELLRPA